MHMKKTVFSHLPQDIQSRYGKDQTTWFKQELKRELAKIVLLDKEYINVLLKPTIQDVENFYTYRKLLPSVIEKFILALDIKDVNTEDYDNVLKQSEILYKDFLKEIEEEKLQNKIKEIALEFMMKDLEDRVPDYNWLRSLAKWRILARQQENSINLDF